LAQSLQRSSLVLGQVANQ